MQLEPESSSPPCPLLFNQRWIAILFVGFMFASALGIRAYHIDEPPLDFHPTRQYRSAFIARAYYYDSTASVPQWKKEIADLNGQGEGILEPPIMETFASFAYGIVGGEDLRIPRLMSALFWMIGGVFLFLLAKKITSLDGAVFSTAFYLFLPFGISASRSFQPDSMMVMMILAGIFAIFRYYTRPSVLSLLIAALASASALFIKPTSLFVIFGAFISLGILKGGLIRFPKKDFFLFSAITVFPFAAYYAYGVLSGGILRAQALGTFFPRLFLDPFYWGGWLYRIGLVVGSAALVAALLGTLIMVLRGGMARHLLLGLWAGYVAFGLVFNYHIHTHDYYSLQLIPIVAIALGPIAVLIVDHLGPFLRMWHWRVAVLGIFVLSLFPSLVVTGQGFVAPGSERFVREAREIGEIVGHSTKTVVLTYAYGKPLMYHGEFAGISWPLSGDLRLESLMGVPERSVEERFREMSNYSPEYFIVTDFQEFGAQSDLRNFLTGSFAVQAQSNDYLIFNLKKRIDVARGS